MQLDQTSEKTDEKAAAKASPPVANGSSWKFKSKIDSFIMCYDYTSHSPMLTVTLFAFTKIEKCLFTCNEFIKSIGLQANLKLKVLLLHLHNSMVPN